MNRQTTPAQRQEKETVFTNLHGEELLRNPVLNKGTAFSAEERHTFGLQGKLPYTIETLEQQAARAYLQYQEQPASAHKSLFLHELHTINRTLFYKLIAEHLKEMLPILYTPSVAHAVTNFSHDFHSAHGFYLAYPEIDNLDAMIKNYSASDIDLIVVTDGEGVLGIGDQGIGAIHIPIAKLMLYTLFGGINPQRTLPIMLDVGTNNHALLNDPLYLGWRHPRLEKATYNEFVDKFVTKITRKFPHVFLHWEDFGRDNAAHLLTHYRDTVCSFNDDMQGTGVVTVAALLAALKATEQEWRDQRIVIFGAGTSGIGIAKQLLVVLRFAGLSEEEAHSKIWLIDKQGLLTDQLDQSQITAAQQPFLHRAKDVAGWKLLRSSTAQTNFIALHDVVENLHPTILLGCSTQGSTFTETIVREMAQHVKHPIIFPLSNPTEKCEANPSDLVRWSDGRAIIATGSPFAPVQHGSKTIPITQCNNALAFPGIGCGILAAQASKLTDAMLWAACQAIAATSPVLLAAATEKHEHASPEERQQNQLLLPPLAAAAAVASEVALAVALQAERDGVNTRQHKSEAALREFIEQHTWTPNYLPYEFHEA